MTSSPLTAAAPATSTSPVGGRRRRRLRRFTRRDVGVLAVLLGIPVALDLALIWATTIASIGLSFTSYNGVTAIKWVGWRNYDQIFTIYEPFWRAVRNNLLWLGILGLIATPLGLFLAYLLDKNIRLTRVYQSLFYMPVVLSLAVVGFIAQLMFSMRFIVQWIASERARRSIVPETFWYFSMIGGAMLLAYSIYRMDPVFMLGQAMGLIIYSRNIYFIRAHNKSEANAAAAAATAAPSPR